MKEKYLFGIEDTGFGSEFESDDGRVYLPTKVLGEGCYSRAREFKSKDKKKSKTVISPIDQNNIDYQEVHTKYRFFKTLYPEHSIKLIECNNTYRLILPFIKGTLYSSLNIVNPAQQITVFLSAIQALKNAHKKGYAVIDFKEDNIILDIDSEQSFLIDGGLSAQIGTDFVNPNIFLMESEFDAQNARAKYVHLAPECWSTTATIANETMDIFSLGSLMHRLQKFSDKNLTNIINQCLCHKPETRPSLLALEKILTDLLNHYLGKASLENKSQFVMEKSRLTCTDSKPLKRAHFKYISTSIEEDEPQYKRKMARHHYDEYMKFFGQSLSTAHAPLTGIQQPQQTIDSLGFFKQGVTEIYITKKKSFGI